MAVDLGVAMPHEPLASLDELLAPATLSRLAGRPIATVQTAPFSGGHAVSGSRLQAILTNDGHGPRFVVKRMSREWDWIMRATADDRCREAMAWTTGLLDRLPPEVTHPIVACARDGAGWAILMRDVSDALFPVHDPYVGTSISTRDDGYILDALAALHVAFWGETAAVDPAKGFCSLRHRFGAFSAAVARREAGGPNVYPRVMREGWDVLPALIDPGVADLVAALALDPTPLAAALARYPQTIVHGDVRPPNIGLVRNGTGAPSVMLLDWQFLGPGAPAVDLAWYLYCAGPSRPTPREAGIACFRDRLARRLGSRFDDAWWQPQLELSLLGEMVCGGHDMAWAAVRHECAAARHSARESLAWWSERAKTGARWL